MGKQMQGRTLETSAKSIRNPKLALPQGPAWNKPGQDYNA